MTASRGPRTVRFDADLNRQLKLAALRAGVTPSQLIRDAVEMRCQELLGQDALLEWADYIGAVRGTGAAPHAREAGYAFARGVEERQRLGRRRMSS
jgi:hypothetical protein